MSSLIYTVTFVPLNLPFMVFTILFSSFSPNTHIGILLSLARIDAVISTTCKLLCDHIINGNLIIFLCIRIYLCGSLSYTPSIAFASRDHICFYSQWHAVQLLYLLKNKDVLFRLRKILPCSWQKYLLARSLENSFVNEPHSNGVRICRHHSYASEDLRYINTVHDRCQHSDLICLGTVDIFAGTSTPEITAADHNTNLYAVIDKLLLPAVPHHVLLSHQNRSFLSPASASPLSFSITLFISLSPITLSLGLFCDQIIKEICRIYFCVALAAHTFDHRTVVDLYGSGFDIPHYNWRMHPQTTGPCTSISPLISACDHRTGSCCNITDHNGILIPILTVPSNHHTCDMCTVCKYLRSFGISFDRNRKHLTCRAAQPFLLLYREYPHCLLR